MASARQHLVQFFDSHQTAATAVAEFVRAGLAQNERVVLIARLADWNRAAVDLSRDVALSEAIDSGQLTVRDSTRTLDAISVDGWPSPERFERVVGRMIAAAHGGGGALRAYGDMVDVLAADGRCDAAARLEELWNDLRARVPFTLFCGYSSGHFCGAQSGEVLRQIRQLHSHEQCAPCDLVAANLLEQNAAHSR
jgi:hypothetical protein